MKAEFFAHIHRRNKVVFIEEADQVLCELSDKSQEGCFCGDSSRE
jgi:hypothetical protein